MAEFNMKQHAFDKAWSNTCEGSCEDHIGECKVICVAYNNHDWYFSYCDEAIEEDKRRGFDVQLLNVVSFADIKSARNTKEEEHQAKVELGVIVEDRER